MLNVNLIARCDSLRLTMQHNRPICQTSLLHHTASSLCLLLALFASVGCEAIGMVATAIVPPSVPASFVIVDRPTLIMVDDRKGLLRDPQLAMLAAAHANEILRAEEAVTTLIPTDQLSALASELGEKYSQTSPYEIGRRLGAKQVILVNLFAASISPEPGILKPSANVGIKLFDVDSNERMFPPSPNATGRPDPPETEGFFMHKVALKVKTSEANPSRIDALARRKLAEEIGLRVALLFTEHDPTKYDDIRAGY